ncbi:uncharacterized protein TRIADDRAFT_51967 [Trichoplax adhaerens]|uniref:Low molecular weight phosphotyrosine protein phosphatase n=1 Tax=Trichoplax adhaerens TaxID=10228 RepID=B3RLD4_TRIAD|nr:hypothetical protein TRIADDRAFT_51967 [Trichoplax adhaerens]EDV29523.1 hypothetical protein TRIADDRAFT_51967 [Trichoplax adhaerens]|eukprot:XP_002108725.1 hypothetical protein TRIADDRAFT_51967 [Trichoplax adhaerens]
MAEGIFINLVKERGIMNEWEIGSAATSTYEIGEPPDDRTMTVLSRHNIQDYSHFARQIRTEDYTKFEFIFGMDESNIRNIKHMSPRNSTASINLLGSFSGDKQKIIQDPYYSHNLTAFEKVYEQCLQSCKGFLDHVYQQNG